MNDKERDVIILRRLKTKDGIISAIQELPEYKMSEERLVRKKLSAFLVQEYDTWKTRRYTIKRQTSCILLEMEEE